MEPLNILTFLAEIQETICSFPKKRVLDMSLSSKQGR